MLRSNIYTSLTIHRDEEASVLHRNWLVVKELHQECLFWSQVWNLCSNTDMYYYLEPDRITVDKTEFHFVGIFTDRQVNRHHKSKCIKTTAPHTSRFSAHFWVCFSGFSGQGGTMVRLELFSLSKRVLGLISFGSSLLPLTVQSLAQCVDWRL